MNWILPCLSTTYMLCCQEQAGGKKFPNPELKHHYKLQECFTSEFMQAQKKRLYGGEILVLGKKLHIEYWA